MKKFKLKDKNFWIYKTSNKLSYSHYSSQAICLIYKNIILNIDDNNNYLLAVKIIQTAFF